MRERHYRPRAGAAARGRGSPPPPGLAGADGLVCVVEGVFGADEAEFDRDTQSLAGLDEIFASAGVAGAGLPGVRRGPGCDQFLLRPGQRGDLVDPGEFAWWQA